MMRERMDRIAHGLVGGSGFGMKEGQLGVFYGEACGRYREMDDFLKMKYEDLKGE